jgi:uncharacterized OB-fold protein
VPNGDARVIQIVPGFEHQVPYIVAVIELEEQPSLKVLANLFVEDGVRPRIGDRVHVVFEWREGVALPQFALEQQ